MTEGEGKMKKLVICLVGVMMLFWSGLSFAADCIGPYTWEEMNKDYKYIINQGLSIENAQWCSIGNDPVAGIWYLEFEMMKYLYKAYVFETGAKLLDKSNPQAARSARAQAAQIRFGIKTIYEKNITDWHRARMWYDTQHKWEATFKSDPRFIKKISEAIK